MKSFLINLILIVGTVSIAHSQETKKADLERYYYHVYNSEQSFIQKEYLKAALHYDSAFEILDAPFSIDIYHALVCAVLLERHDAALVLAKRFVLKGADTSFFLKSIFKGFRSTPQWEKLLTDYGSLSDKRDNMNNLKLKRCIDSFLRIDQGIHCKLPENDSIASFVEAMHRLDDSLSEHLREMMLTNTYLSEEVIGANITDTLFSPFPKYYLLALHEFQRGSKKLLEALNEGVQHGKIRSDIALNLIQNYSGIPRIVYTDDYFIYRDSLYVTLNSDEIQTRLITRLLKYTDERTGSLRKFYFMDSPENTERKIVEWYKGIHNNSPFINAFILREVGSFDGEQSFLFDSKPVYKNSSFNGRK